MWTFEYEEYYPGSKEFEKLAPDKKASYYVVNHEIDIELPGRPDGADSATDYNYALCNTFTGERGDEYTSTHAKLENAVNDGKYHTYRFDWHTGSSSEQKRVDYYVDNKLIASNTTNVPTHKGRFWIGIWFPNGWAGEANFDRTELDVDYVKITPFNEEGDVLSNETYPNDGWGDINKINYNLKKEENKEENKEDNNVVNNVVNNESENKTEVANIVNNNETSSTKDSKKVNNINQNLSKDIADKKIPQTGENYYIKYAVVILIVVTIFNAVKYIKSKKRNE